MNKKKKEIISLFGIRKENKLKKEEAKKIKNINKNLIIELKKNFLKKIKLESNLDNKKYLKENFKNKFKYGFDNNKPGNIIDISGLNKYFCNRINCEHILKDIELEIKKNNIVVILGASGSGKSTLLNIMSGLTPPTNGDVIVNGKNMTFLNEAKRTKFREENLSFVFQSYNLIPSLTAIENIKVGENLRNKSKKEIPINDILKTLDLTKQAKKYPFQLSGGQNQRISIGRALAKNPEILFADEPTGALDEEKGKNALQLLIDINKKYKTTLVMVTHNPNFSGIADMVIYIKDGKIDKIIKNKSRKKIKDINWS